MRADVETIVHEQVVYLSEETLRTIGFPDMKVADKLHQDFPIVGDRDDSPLLPSIQESEYTQGAFPSWLTGYAKQMRAQLENAHRRQRIQETSKVVYYHTARGPANEGESDSDKEWSKGPFPIEQMTQKFGHPFWVASRRSEMFHGKRVRPTDDFSQFPQNACTTIGNKIAVVGADAIVSMVQVWADALREALSISDLSFPMNLSGMYCGVCPTNISGTPRMQL